MTDEAPPERHEGNGKNGQGGNGQNGQGKLAHNDPRRANHLKQYQFKEGNTLGKGRRGQVSYFKKAYADLLKTEIPAKVMQSGEAAKITIEKMVLGGARIVDFVALAQILRAMNGDTRAAAEIADRVDGKALQQMRVEAVDPNAAAGALDFSQLTADEIETMIGLYKKAGLERPADPS